MAVIRWLERTAWAGMVVFGLAMALLGAILPLITNRLALDLVQAGSLFAVLNAAMLATMLAVGPFMDSFGERPALAAGALLTALALGLIARAASYPALLVALALLGVGGSALNASTNTLVANLHPEPAAKNAALNMLGMFFGIGALAIPLAIGRLLEMLGLPAILILAAAVSLVPAAGAVALPFPHQQRAKAGIGALLRLARQKLVLLFGALLFFESSSELILSGYASLYLVREGGMNVRAASYVLAGYWATIMAARLLLSRTLLRVSGPKVVLASALVTAAWVTVMARARATTLMCLAVLAAGASMAGIYPTVLGQVAACFATRAGTVFGLLFAIALLGGVTLPWLAGELAQAHGLRTALLLPAASAMIVFVLQLVIARKTRRLGA